MFPSILSIRPRSPAPPCVHSPTPRAATQPPQAAGGAPGPTSRQGPCDNWRLDPTFHVCLPQPVSAVHLGGTLLTAVAGNDAYLWRRHDAAPMARPPPHGRAILASVSDGHRLATACMDGTVRLWDTRAGREIFLIAPPLPAGGLALCDNILAVACAGSTMLLDATHGGGLRQWAGDSSAPLTPVVDAHGMAVREGTQVHLCSRASADPVRSLAGHRHLVTAIALGGAEVATGAADGTTLLWERGSGRCLRRLSGSTGQAVHSLGFHRRRLVVGRGDICELVCCRSGRQLGVMPGLGGRLPAGQPLGHLWAAVAASGKEAQIWRLARRGAEATPQRWGDVLPQPGGTLSLAARGHSLALAGDDGQVGVWRLRSGVCEP